MIEQEFKYTTALDKIRRMTKRIKIVQGGTSASKTFSIIPILIDMACRRKLSISIVSESMPHLRKGALRDFINIMKMTNRYVDEHWNRTNSIYTFANGSYIEFFPADSADKLRGSRRNILFVNECNNISSESYTQLSMRTDQDIYLDYNPSHRFWIEDVELSEESEKIILTYKDNEALSRTIIDFLESKRELAKTSEYWSNWCRVYLDGEQGSIEGTIFTNWREIDSIPSDAKLLGYGMDFGFSNDPTTLVALYKLDDRTIILDELIHQKGLLGGDIAGLIKQLDIKDYIYADNEPRTIAEIRSYGINIVRTKKISIKEGLHIMLEYNMLVTKGSVNLISELKNYSWMQRGDQNIPMDAFNHCFVGDTLITTDNGDIPIRDIKEGDMVLTSIGYKKVLKRFNNGVKPVKKYRMMGDIFDIYISSTPEHKIKTNEGWIEISKLKSGMMVTLTKNTMVKDITYITEKDILIEDVIECTQMYGSSTMDQYQKDITYTTLMKTPGIIESKISNVLNHQNIYQNTQSRDIEITQSGQEDFMKLELKQQRNGTPLQKDCNGIQNTELEPGLIENIKLKYVNSVERNMKQELVGYQNSVTTTAKLRLVQEGNEWNENVYDLMIEDQHEYFANGVLVHNCIDASRYICVEKLGNRSDTIDIINLEF